MKIAVTGKPDIGKTTILRIVECEFPNTVIASGDAFEALNRNIFPNTKSTHDLRCQQRAFYYVQKEMENIIEDQHSKKLILCDHGSLDLLAIWPDTPETFFNEMGTSLTDELNRYDWVLQINGFERQFDLLARFKVFHEPKLFWQQHHHFLEIPVQKGFSFSYMQTALAIKNILAGRSYVEIREILHMSSSQNHRSGFLSSSKDQNLSSEPDLI